MAAALICRLRDAATPTRPACVLSRLAAARGSGVRTWVAGWMTAPATNRDEQDYRPAEWHYSRGCKVIAYLTELYPLQRYPLSCPESSSSLTRKSFKSEEYRLLGCDASWLLWEPAIRRNKSPPSSGRKISELGTTLADSCHPEEGGDTFLQNYGSYKSHTASHPRRRNSS
jgi:hypothetical protein